MVTPRNGELLIAATQDFLTGAYLLTKKDVFFDFKWATLLASTILALDDADMAVQLPTPCILKVNFLLCFASLKQRFYFQPRKLWSGKQIISLIFKPNDEDSVQANLEAKGKAYTKNKEMCVKDAYVLIRNSELIAGTLDKGHLGSGGKSSNIFYIILRDVGQDAAIRSMWRLGKNHSLKNVVFPTFLNLQQESPRFS